MSVDPYTALHALAIAARRHGLDLTAKQLARTHGVGQEPLAVAHLLRIARASAMRAECVALSWQDLINLGAAYPALALLENGNAVVVTGCATDAGGEPAVLVIDPLADASEPFDVPQTPFCSRWRGDVVLLKPTRRAAAQQRFGLRWFVPELARQGPLLRDVAVAAVVLYGLGLAMPIYMQLVIDKVLVHESYATLYVLTAGVALALGFEALFTFLRRYLLLYATNRIDIRVATRTFGHLLALPMGFFERASAGVLVKHMQQTARIREFLTGRLFLTLLDGLSLFVFVPVLLMYSPKLAMVVLVFAAIVAIVVTLLIGPYQRRLQALYRAEGERQALLVETVHGMRTIKSLVMEPLQQRTWDGRSAQAVTMRFRVERISALAQAAISLTERLMNVAIIGFGALAVFDGSLTIGALIAFNMLASRVSGPLVQIVATIHEYQDVALSVRMLGEVMNAQPERDRALRGLQPPLRGNVEFDGVTFRYAPDAAPALDDVSFTIPMGSIFGVVGRSGSGKTTLTRLVQGLYPFQLGVLRIDGYDLRELDLAHLRQHIGVVLQDSFLFRGTIRENIGAAKPDASFEDIVLAAQLAGAEEFIARLPRGFDTLIEENAENLSGGQRQRLAIARALVTQPQLLILDEATSALDPESELVVRRNLRRIAEGRTVIIVSHRLSTLADAHAILVLDEGRVVDLAGHDQLLSRCTLYRQLWSQQMRHVA
jgi:subfamily B ATP-binding cassette protein HlyB/CyaB